MKVWLQICSLQKHEIVVPYGARVPHISTEELSQCSGNTYATETGMSESLEYLLSAEKTQKK